MQDILIVLADAGHFKAYNVSKDNHKMQKFNLVEDYDSQTILKRMGDTFEQRSGTFGRENHLMGHSGFGEKSSVNGEQNRKAIVLMADTINHLVKSTHYKEWYLASNHKIHNTLLEHIEPTVRNNLKEDILADLVSAGKRELLNRFHIN